MLNTEMENENENFTNSSIFSEIKVVDHIISDHDLKKEIKIIVQLFFSCFGLVFNIMKLLAKVKAGKTMTKE